jgi:hypothetical protein
MVNRTESRTDIIITVVGYIPNITTIWIFNLIKRAEIRNKWLIVGMSYIMLAESVSIVKKCGLSLIFSFLCLIYYGTIPEIPVIMRVSCFQK